MAEIVNDTQDSQPTLLTERPVDPTHIPPQKVQSFALANGLEPVEAFRQLLSHDLLERIELSTADSLIKAVVKVCVTSTIGTGIVKKKGRTLA